MAKLKDSLGRKINYVRISLTDRCNFRCRYCMPEEGVNWLSHEEILTYEELLRLTGLLWEMGIQKIRFTGGEPLVRKGIISFLRSVRDNTPDLRLTLTTNGAFLDELADQIASLDLSGINVSLDTVDPEKFRFITRCGELQKVLQGLAAVREKAPDLSIKINTVLIRGFNDMEVPSLLQTAQDAGAVLRLIEFMPLDSDVWSKDRFISSDEILNSLRQTGNWVEILSNDHSAGPARYFRHSETGQRIGVIAAVSHHFCPTCNRLRITATGEIRPCLFSKDGLDLRHALRSHDMVEAERIIRQGIQTKPKCWMEIASGTNHMSQIGG